jgi:Carbohydrate family 9 binding domain-like
MLRIARVLPLIPVLFVFPLLALEPTPSEPNPLGYVCLKTTKPPTIDGKIDDEVWKAAPWSSDFVDIEGEKKPKPRHRTRMKMLWDEQALYIAAEIEEPHLWATLKEHDSVIFQDPDFELFLDPDGDNHMYAELELNALNTTWDLLLTKPYRDGGKAINAWEVLGLKSAVHRIGTLNDPSDLDKSWSVEICWPFTGLKELTSSTMPPVDGQQWRINFSRVEWDTTIENGKYVKVKGKPEYNWVWSPQGVIDMHRPERWGYLQFSTKTTGPVEYRPDPAQGVKDRLHEVYYAQQNYQAKNGRYAKTIADLGLKNSPLGIPELESTSKSFEAHLKSPKAAGGKLWSITHDSQLTSK